MRSNERTTILICFLISLVLNAGGMLAVHFAMKHPTPTFTYVSMLPEEELTDEDDLEREEREFTPGIEDGAIATVTWIGYNEYEEHLARQSEVEQAAFTMAEAGGGGGAAGQPVQSTTSPIDSTLNDVSPPAPLAAAAPDGNETNEAENAQTDAISNEATDPNKTPEVAAENNTADVDEPTGVQDAVDNPGEADPPDTGDVANELVRPDTGDEGEGAGKSATEMDEAQPDVKSPTKTASTSEIRDVPDDTTDAASRNNGAQTAENEHESPTETKESANSDDAEESFEEFIRQLLSEMPGEMPGNPGTPSPEPRDPAAESSDKESDATSVKKIPEVEWNSGKPLAVEGLDIKPYPLFRHIAVDSKDSFFFVGSWGGRVQQNPVVALSFDRTGNVAAIRVYRETGLEPFDRKYLKTWLSRWQASGKQLAELPDNEKAMTNPIVFRLIFIRENPKSAESNDAG